MHELALEMVVGWAAGAALWRLRRGQGHEGLARWSVVGLSAAIVGWWQPRGLVVTLALCVLAWTVVRLARRPRLSRTAVKCLLAGGVAVMVAALAGARYLSPATAAPLGLSFTVFRLIGVTMDGVALGAAVPLERVLLLALFFPTYCAGPITTLQNLREAAEGEADRSWAVRRIVLGVCRKLLLADTLAALVTQPWLARDPALLRPELALLLPVLLSLWVYWDFAGYSDIAIGVAALLGYRVPENFDRPYLSRNLLEFWRRWHMTLSEWIRTRLFMKLAGRRPATWRVYAAILASMGLCGVWHGIGVNFLVWGLWHGAGMVAVHAFRAVRRGASAAGPGAGAPAETLAALVTFVYVSVGWLLFFLPLDRALAVGGRALIALARPRGVALAAASLAAYALAHALARTGWSGAGLWRFAPVPVRGLVYALVTLFAIVQMADPASFIYFRF